MTNKFDTTLSEKPYVSREDAINPVNGVLHNYKATVNNKERVVRKTAFYDKIKMRYNDDLSKYEPFKKGADGKHDSENGKLVYEVFLYTKSTDKNDKQTTVERKVIKKKNIIDGDTKRIDDRNYYAPAYKKYLDFKTKGCKTKKDFIVENELETLKNEKVQANLEKEALKKQVAELQKQAKEKKNKETVQKPISIINKKNDSNDSSDDKPKYSKGRKN